MDETIGQPVDNPIDEPHHLVDLAVPDLADPERLIGKDSFNQQ